MLTLKDLPIFILSRNNQDRNKKPQLNPIATANKKSFPFQLQKQKPVFGARGIRLSNKTIIEQSSINKDLKRRISTAGTSKRFPKDFFKMDLDDDKSPKFLLNLHKKSIISEVASRNRNLDLSQEYLQEKPVEANGQNTPKFMERENSGEKSKDKDSLNQFLPYEVGNRKGVTPFMSLDALKITQTVNKCEKRGKKFVKKVRKGEFLKNKFPITRTLSENQYRDHRFGIIPASFQ